MSIFNLFSMLGGLALFLFGMDTMGKSLEKQAGSQLQTILRHLTDNRMKGFFLGLLVTAVIQSSSATTVMVVGFVNSGIMQLSQAIGIIMGANVGTTVTAWILSLAGIQGSNFFLKLLKPTSFSPVLAFIGILLYMASKKEQGKNIGLILLGFAILMTGMSTMSHAVEPLSEVPAFTNLFLMFQNPILGMVVGAVLTGIIQSSSASVGILQALALSTGAVTFGSAIPIIMGQNIGTCVTAMLSSVGANKNARRTALVHLYFNVIGAVTFLVVFYAINMVYPFPFLAQKIDAAGIAIVHTAFNVVATACLLPFTGHLEKLAYLTIPDDEQKETVMLLDERLLNTPAVALEQTLVVTKQMAELSQTAFLKGLSLLNDWEEERFDAVREHEESTDAFEDQIASYLVQLSRHDLTLEDSRTVSVLFHIISDLERIGDHALTISILAKGMKQQQLSFSAQASEELGVLEQAVQEVLSDTIKLLESPDEEKAQRISLLNRIVTDLIGDIRERHVERLQDGECTIQSGIRLNDLLTNLQRVSSHCTNIAIGIAEAQTGGMERHAYRERCRKTDSFLKRYENYRLRYGLALSE